ncbi:MAG: nuclear transport factor 2 family protein [Solirubrobacteraceae bacterium]
MLASPSGSPTTGIEALRGTYEQLLAGSPTFKGEVRPALRVGDLALTSTRFAGGATAEVAHQQADGTWLWLIDQPNVLA